MNKEKVATQLRHYAQLSWHYLKVAKDFTVKKYHQFAEYLSEKHLERKNNGANAVLGMSCAKYMLVLLNVFYVLLALYVILIGTSGYLVHGTSGYLGHSSVIQILSIFWIVAGAAFMAIAFFGIIGSFKESVVLANIYAVLLMISFILQISAAIAAFSLIGNSRSYASNLIYDLMETYGQHDSAQKMDWIQENFSCCGATGPNDWTYMTSKTPTSCCNEWNRNETCTKYYSTGCITKMSDFISESILIIATSALVIAVVQILGVVSGFTLARLLRQTKSYRYLQKWETESRVVLNTPTYINYTPLDNNNGATHI